MRERRKRKEMRTITSERLVAGFEKRAIPCWATDAAQSQVKHVIVVLRNDVHHVLLMARARFTTMHQPPLLWLWNPSAKGIRALSNACAREDLMTCCVGAVQLRDPSKLNRCSAAPTPLNPRHQVMLVSAPTVCVILAKGNSCNITERYVTISSRTTGTLRSHYGLGMCHNMYYMRATIH